MRARSIRAPRRATSLVAGQSPAHAPHAPRLPSPASAL